jgi:hypothetical protein
MDELEVLDRPNTQQKQLARLLTPSGAHELSVVAVPGETIQELVDRAIPVEMRDYVVAFNHGMKINEPENFWIQEQDSILLTLVPQGGGGGGGKNVLAAVLTIAVVVAAWYVAPALVGGTLGGMSALGTGAAVGTSAIAGQVVAMGISMVGMMALNALIPPPSVAQPSSGVGVASSPTYSLGGQSNSMKKYQPVARVYGRHRVFPQLASNPLVTNLGTQSSIASLYDFGLGNIQVEDLKIGDTLASTYSPELIWHQNSYVTNTTYLTNRVGYEQFQYTLKTGSELIVRTKQATTAFDVDLSFPRGLCYFDNNGNATGHSVYINVQYRKLGETTWRDIPASSVKGVNAWEQVDPPPIDPENPEAKNVKRSRELKKLYGKVWTGDQNQRIGISGSTSSQFVAVISVTPPDVGEFEFRIIKGDADDSGNTRISETMVVTMMKSYKDGSVVNLNKKHTMLEMKVTASEKLSGNVSNLSGLCTSILRTTLDGETFVDKPTSNPAWIALDILTSEANRKPIPDNLIDWQSFIKFAKHCEDKKYYVNCVVDYKTTVQQLLSSVLSNAHATMLFTTSGKYGVLIDREQTTPRQLITPANSWGFRGGRTFTDIPHAFLVTFINGEKSSVIVDNAPDINWQKEERIVYNDGYDETNATVFETLDTFGITNPDQAWKYGRYMLAQGTHRSEMFSVTMDIENLAVQRGDLVHVAHDAAKIGGVPVKVVWVDETKVYVNQTFSTMPNGYSIRLSDGMVRTGRIIVAVADTYGTLLTLDNVTGIESDDLMVIGTTERIVGQYIVQSISAGADLTAELTLVKYVPGIYQAEDGAIPPWDAEMSQDLIDSTDLRIASLKANQSFIYVDRKPYASIVLDWTVSGFGYSRADVYMSVLGGSETFLGSSTTYTYNHLMSMLENANLVGVPITFRVVPLTAGGVAGVGASTSIELLRDTTPPSDITGYNLNIQSETIQLSWDKNKDPDLDYYELRYSPTLSLPTWTNSQTLAIVPWSSNTVSVGARTGTYFLRASDTSGNVSKVVGRRTTVETLPNIEIIKDIDDRLKLWPGVMQNFSVREIAINKMMSDWDILSDVVRLDEVAGGVGDLISSGPDGAAAPESFYTFEKIIDLGHIFEVRISSKIQAHGEYTNGSDAPTELWDCWLEGRGTSELNFISSWDTLASQADMIGTAGKEWSDWRPFTVTDATVKLVEFRIRAKSYDPNVRVVVTDGSVIIDAVDRIWSKNDVTIPMGLTTIYFDPPFIFDDVAVAISVDGSEVPLISRVTNKNRLSFDVELRNAMTDAPESGKIDVVARGQGKERPLQLRNSLF